MGRILSKMYCWAVSHSGLTRLDDEIDGILLLNPIATLEVTLQLLHDLDVLFNSACVAESRSVHNRQRIAQSTSFIS